MASCGAAAGWAARKMDELEAAEEKGCGCCTVQKAAKVYEWPEETKWYRLAIEGLEDDFERMYQKADGDEPTAEDDIRDGERKTPAMAIRAIVSENLRIVRERFVEALRSGEIAPIPSKAASRSEALRAILRDLTGARDKALDDLLAAFESAARGGSSVGSARLNELLANVNGGRLSTPDLSKAVTNALKKRAALLTESIFENTLEQFNSNIGKDFTVDREINRIMTEDPSVSEARAEMIARTESANAYHEGQIDAWEQSGVTDKKHFLMAPGACEFCQAVNKKYGEKGKAIPIRQPMVKAGETITGTNGKTMKVGRDSMGTVHPNCRCDFIAVLEDFG